MSAVEGKKIAIVGGGPGGLTLARDCCSKAMRRSQCMSVTRAAVRASRVAH